MSGHLIWGVCILLRVWYRMIWVLIRLCNDTILTLHRRIKTHIIRCQVTLSYIVEAYIELPEVKKKAIPVTGRGGL
jgi:hypothetical protein